MLCEDDISLYIGYYWVYDELSLFDSTALLSVTRKCGPVSCYIFTVTMIIKTFTNRHDENLKFGQNDLQNTPKYHM